MQTTKVMQHKRVQKPHQLINGKAVTLKDLPSVSLFATVVRVFTENLFKTCETFVKNYLTNHQSYAA